MAPDQAERVLVGEIHVGFVDHEQTALEAFRQRAQVARSESRCPTANWDCIR